MAPLTVAAASAEVEATRSNFPEVTTTFKFSRLPIMAIISIFYGLRIPRTIYTARLS
jgi:hypothetical protein